MQYVGNTLCASGAELIISEKNPNGFISLSLWKKWQRTGVKIIQRACFGKPALIDFNTIPEKYRNEIAVKLGLPQEQATIKTFKDRVIADANAVTFYSNYKLSDGRFLPDAVQREYAINAAVLNAIKIVQKDSREMRQKLGKPQVNFWGKAITAVNNIRVELGHTLPATDVTLQRRFTKYVNEGYAALISGKYCNDNSRKVSDKIENLIMSIYTMPNKPFVAKVHELYLQFLTGKFSPVDRKTGEVFDPKDFYENGEPIVIGEKTVWNYLNMPGNRMIVDKVRMGAHRYNNTHRPHHHRHAPEFSFSKITMDDRDLPRKCTSNKYVKAYYSYDVASGCVIGASYSLNKDETLFLDCMKDMFRLIEREGFGMPLEVEVENHLVNKFFDDLAIMFPFVRICNPGNSQEKHAEHFNRAKKYGVEKNTQSGIGRWWSRHDAYQVDRDKINDEFVEKMFTYERLVADDMAACQAYNNQLHPKQKKYPGKTRWQVLVENMNPNTPQVSKPIVYKAIGYKTQTSIRRNQYATVRGDKFQIPNLSVIDRLNQGDYTVDAYFLPDAEGLFTEVFLFQNSEYLCRAEKLGTYNTAKAEQTDADRDAFKLQSEFVGRFDAKSKEGKNELAKIVMIENSTIADAMAQEVTIIEEAIQENESLDDQLTKYQAENSDDDAINMM